MTRKLLLATGVMLAVASSFVARAADPDPTIKVAFLAIDSGPFAVQKEENLMGVRQAIDYINQHGGANGRKFELVIETDDGTPASALVAATRAVKQDGAKFILGMFTSSIAASLVPRAAALGAIVIDPWSQSDDLVGKGCGSNYFRTSTANSMIVNAAMEFVKQSGIKTWDVISVDYAAGHDFSEKFAKSLTEAGGTINANVFAPLGTNDFGSYISQLASTSSNGLMVTIFGSDAIAFSKQQAQFGLFKKYKLVFGNGFTHPTLLKAQGDGVLGVYATLSYEANLANEKNQDYAKAFAGRYNQGPTYNDADIYVGLELLKSAIEKTKSSDVSAVREGLSGLKIDSIYGPVEMRAADHQAIRQELIVQVVKDNTGTLAFGIKTSMEGPVITPPASAECKM